MSAEPLIAKLVRALADAQETLRAQFTVKIAQVAAHVGIASPAEVREELDRLADDFLAQFAAAYQELIAAVEEGLPAAAAPPKSSSPKKKAPKKEPADGSAFVRPTYVQRAFTVDGLRVAKAARPGLMEVLNDAIKEDIARIKQQLPTITKGEREGEKKRVTVQPEDVAKAKFAPKTSPPPSSAAAEQDLDTIPLGDDAPGHQIAVVLRPTSATRGD